MAQDFAKSYKLAGKETAKPRGAVVLEEPSPSKLNLIKLESLLGIKLPAWSWLALGLLAGSFLGYYLALAGLTSQLKTQQVELPPSSTATKQQLAKAATSPKFEFYTQLLTSEVEAPAIEAYKSTPREATDVPSYLVQAGSFNKYNDALKQQQRIRNLRFNKVQITPIETASGETWYRVHLGPSQDRRELARMQNTLNSAGIESLRIRVNLEETAQPVQAVKPASLSTVATEAKTAQETPAIKETPAAVQPTPVVPAIKPPAAIPTAPATPQDTSLEELGNL